MIDELWVNPRVNLALPLMNLMNLFKVKYYLFIKNIKYRIFNNTLITACSLLISKMCMYVYECTPSRGSLGSPSPVEGFTKAFTKGSPNCAFFMF